MKASPCGQAPVLASLQSVVIGTAPEGLNFEEQTMFFLSRRFLNFMVFVWALTMVLSLATARADSDSPGAPVEPSRVGLHETD